MNISKLRPFIILMVLIACGGIILLYAFNLLNIGSPAEAKTLEIKEGMSFDEVADELKKIKLIDSKFVVKLYGLITGQANQVKPGRYILSNNNSLPQLLEILTQGPTEVSAFIAPGMTLKEIDEKLSTLGVIERNDLVNLSVNSFKKKYPWLKGASSLEGFLLPDTYIFFSASDVNSVVNKFLDNFEEKALPFFINGNNLLETVNLASILEKEVPDYQERRMVAGILIKRLNIDMLLQVDASLIYGKCFGKFLNCPSLQEADYKFDSPYNTYLYKGLPETPICNPDIDAIKAASDPEKSDYWYYLSDPNTKKTVFSKTLDEQNENRAKYLR